MGKLKTHKSIVKRFTINKSGKIMKRVAGQDHFNSGERGRTTRAKRLNKQVAKSEYGVIAANV